MLTAFTQRGGSFWDIESRLTAVVNNRRKEADGGQNDKERNMFKG